MAVLIIMTKLESIKEFLKRNLLYCNYVSMIIVIVFAIYGWVYLFIYLPLYAGFLLWLFWDQYTAGLEAIETFLWGKPLMYYKESGKPRPKLKFVLKRDRSVSRFQNVGDNNGNDR